MGPGPRCTVGGPAAPPGPAARVGSGRELASPFFAKPIENEYFGIALFAPEPAGASGPLRPGRWVYEKKGAAKAGREKREQRTKRLTRLLPAGWEPRDLRDGPAARVGSGCELASPFFANPIQNEFFGIAFFTPEPAGAWAPLRPGRWVYEKKGKQQPCGEAARESWAPLHGGLRRPLSVPVHHSPHSRGALRYAGVPTIAGEHHPSTATAARP